MQIRLDFLFKRRKHHRNQLVRTHSLRHTKCKKHKRHKLCEINIHRISKIFLHAQYRQESGRRSQPDDWNVHGYAPIAIAKYATWLFSNPHPGSP